jgi:hypothetical protein
MYNISEERLTESLQWPCRQRNPGRLVLSFVTNYYNHNNKAIVHH